MTPEQYRLYAGIVRLARTFGTGGSSWAGVRGTSTGLGAPTFTNLDSASGYFLENNRVAERTSLPDIPIYTAPWWWIPVGNADTQVGDIRTDGTYAFLITGQPDTSQGFQVIPARVYPLIEVPRLALGGGYQAGLRIGAW